MHRISASIRVSLCHFLNQILFHVVKGVKHCYDQRHLRLFLGRVSDHVTTLSASDLHNECANACQSSHWFIPKVICISVFHVCKELSSCAYTIYKIPTPKKKISSAIGMCRFGWLHYKVCVKRNSFQLIVARMVSCFYICHILRRTAHQFSCICRCNRHVEVFVGPHAIYFNRMKIMLSGLFTIDYYLIVYVLQCGAIKTRSSFS